MAGDMAPPRTEGPAAGPQVAALRQRDEGGVREVLAAAH